MLAATLGHVELVKLLSKYEMKLKTNAGSTALMKAAYFNQEACIPYLLEEADINTESGKTAIDYAAEKGNDSIITMILESN